MKHLFTFCCITSLLLAGCERKPYRPDAPHPRIISQSPALTAAMFQMGLQDHLVGVGQYCKLPESGPGSDIPRVCDANGVKIEAAVSIAPELILTQSKKDLFAGVKRALPDVAIETFRIETLDDIRNAITRIGALCNAEVQAAALLKKFNAAMTPESSDTPTGVIFALNPDQPSIPTAGTYIDEMITLAGGQNLGRNVPGTHLWRPVKIEAILARKPEVLIIWTEKANVDRAKAFWAEQTSIPAVTNGKLFFVTDSQWLHPDAGLLSIMPTLKEMIGSQPKP